MPLVDVFQQIRSQLESKPPTPDKPPLLGRQENDDAKVLARNEECYVSEMPFKSCIDYERRAGHSQTGFFSLSHLPYRPFGGFKHADPYNLIEEYFGVSIPRILRGGVHIGFRVHYRER